MDNKSTRKYLINATMTSLFSITIQLEPFSFRFSQKNDTPLSITDILGGIAHDHALLPLQFHVNFPHQTN